MPSAASVQVAHPFKVNYAAGQQKRRLARAVLALLILCTLAPERATAQPIARRRAHSTGIVTDRLNDRDLFRWWKIERLMMTRDQARRPLYPTLYNLWRWINRSGHVVYIELAASRLGNHTVAGSFNLECRDPRGVRHVAVIRLYPDTIDQAYVGAEVQRADGLIPFKGLNREERYAEVLGHELAHAVHILGDPAWARLTDELVTQTNEMFKTQFALRRGRPLSFEMRQRLKQRDHFLDELERQAEVMETIIWHELKRHSRAK